MRKFLFILASTAILAMISPAVAQYMPPSPGVPVAPGYTAPGYRNNPGYMWREQRLNEDRRTNPVQDGQQRNAIERGSVGVTDPTKNYAGECAIGSSEETCRRRGQKYNPPRQD
jgi:hypothetical protein